MATLKIFAFLEILNPADAAQLLRHVAMLFEETKPEGVDPGFLNLSS
jgi:hypothetical protein